MCKSVAVMMVVCMVQVRAVVVVPSRILARQVSGVFSAVSAHTRVRTGLLSGEFLSQSSRRHSLTHSHILTYTHSHSHSHTHSHTGQGRGVWRRRLLYSVNQDSSLLPAALILS